MSNQSYDTARRKKATRGGRDKGCRVYIAADELQRAGIDPHGPEPFYTVRGFQRSRNGHTVIVSLYKER